MQFILCFHSFIHSLQTFIQRLFKWGYSEAQIYMYDHALVRRIYDRTLLHYIQDQTLLRYTYVTQGPKTRHLSFLAFLLKHILHCICFKILFTESKYLVSNYNYTRLLRTIKKVKKSNKMFKIFVSL